MGHLNAAINVDVFVILRFDKIRRERCSILNYFAFRIANVVEGFIKKNVFRVYFFERVIARGIENESIAFAAHSYQSAVLATCTKFRMVSFGGTDEYLSRASEHA